MLSLKHILLPTDFSSRCISAAQHAAGLASHFHSDLTLLHVTAPVHLSLADLESSGVVLEEVLSSRRAAVRDQLESFAAAELRDVPAKRVLMEGDPADEIVEYAQAQNASLIMMPTHGLGTFRRFILGSVTAKVLHDVHCPVWTGAHVEDSTGEPGAPLRAIVCAVDLARHDANPLLWATQFAAEMGAELVVVHAMPSFEFTPETVYLEAELFKTMTTEAQRKIMGMLEECKAAEIRVHQVIAGGNVSKVVKSTAEQHQAGLVVIGRSAPTGILGRLRTNSYAIIRDSPCPVISV